MSDDLRIRVSAELDTNKSNENIKKKVKQVEQEINKTPMQLKIEASTGALKQQANNYEQWWAKSIKNVEQQQIKSANAYQQWWEKSLRLKDIKDEENAKKENQRVLQNTQNYTQWWQQALNRRTQQEEANARKQIEINSRVKNSLNNQRLSELNRSNQVSLFQTQMENKISGLNGGSAGKYVDPTAINNLRQQIASITSSSANFAQVRNQMQLARVEFQRINTEAQNLARNSMSIGDAFSQAFQKFPIWIGVSTIVMQSIHALQNGVQYIVNMDTAMTDLSKVVDLTSQQMEDMRQSAVEMGKALGQSGVDVMKAYAEFGRVTKNPEEIKELTNAALLASNVTTLSAQEAAKSINTTMIAFKLNARESVKIVNEWNELQNNFRKLCGSKIFSN